MAYKPIRMQTINQIRQYYSQGYGYKKISRLLGISRNTVKGYVRKMLELDLDVLHPFDEPTVRQIYSHHHVQQSEAKADLNERLSNICEQLSGVGVTRQILWEEYRSEYARGYSYGQFCREIKSYKAVQNATIRIDHKAGHTMQIDFAGKKLPYYDKATGELLWAEVLVCTLPFSSMVFAYAVASQKQEDFVAAINAALIYFGGVAQVLLSDNLKSYVTRPDRYGPTFTNLCAQLSSHYAMELDATRVAKPKDKGHVERHVSIVYSDVYAPLRNDRFNGLDQLNTAVVNQIDLLNNKTLQGKDYSRRQRFDKHEAQQLQALPNTIFDIFKSTNAKVQQNYHIFLGEDKHMYSVPYQYIGKTTQIVYTAATVEVYIGNQRIAIHKRNTKAHAYTTMEAHRPEKHSKYLEQLQLTPKDLLAQASDIGIHTKWAVQHILDNQLVTSQAHKSCLGVLSLAKKYGHQRLENACQLIKITNTVSYTILRNILTNKTDCIAEQLSDDSCIPDHNNIRGASHYQ